MVMSSKMFGTAILASGIVLACGREAAPNPATGQTTSTTATAKTDDCSANTHAASDAIRAVIAANQSCTKDEDCIVVPQGGCVDQCSTYLGVSGKAAYDKATADVDAKYCAPMRALHCPTPPSPPCAPNPPAKCKAGKCGD